MKDIMSAMEKFNEIHHDQLANKGYSVEGVLSKKATSSPKKDTKVLGKRKASSPSFI